MKFGQMLQLFLVVLLFGSAVYGQENWPQWRGPAQNGVSTSTGLPATWSGTENIVWKTALPSWSGGSPVVWGNRVFVTSPSKAEPKDPSLLERAASLVRDGERDPGGSDLLLLCLSKEDGALLWERKLDDGNETHRKQNSSSPTPVTDGTHVWAVTGTGAVTAFDMEGQELWKRNLQEDYGAFGLMFGYASSPLLHDGMLILQVLHGFRTDDPSYLVAFDAQTGEVRWRVERLTDARSETHDAYTTPTLLRHGDTVLLVVSGANDVTAHDPATGQEIWRAGGLNPKDLSNFRNIASAVAVDGMVYAPSRKKPMLALRAGGTGDVTESHLAWKWTETGGPDVPTPACDGKYFYMADDRGVVTCLDAKSGEVVWGPERTAGGTVSASPIVADGKVYLINEEAVTSVLAAGPSFELLAKNELDGSYALSTPAVAGNRLFVRTATHLYCIGVSTD